MAAESDGKPDEKIHELLMLGRRGLIDDPPADIVGPRGAALRTVSA